MQKKAEINIPELMKTAGENLSVIRKLIEENKAAAEKNDDGRAQLFKDLLVVIEQLQIVHFAVNMIYNESNGDVIRGGVFTPNVGDGFAGQLIDSLINKIQPGDTIQSFAGRECAKLVETVHSFQLEEGGPVLDTESAIQEIVNRGDNPYAVLIDTVLETLANAEKTESFSRLMTPEDFNRDAQAFVGGAMGYQHSLNLINTSPALIKRLEAYKAA